MTALFEGIKKEATGEMGSKRFGESGGYLS